ncbi:mercury(II) reductase [Ruficoccus sp. ZRK36]|uniref:mercury(II) reductase n=1 Tax=Ruficoccus sp. ZRK36 TaxID=2866311 RepID=UPI001C72FB1C|nr:mercury(II) reductase [Ruficoccus sp. ZRK36]QYY35495.1 mercury(II) reductase [Ruficoccus sp. ZRK36]
MTDCCKTNHNCASEPAQKLPADPGHLGIIGGGSAAFAATTRAAERGWRVTIINDGLPIGGTCVNVGCVPSKSLIRAAETHYRNKHHPFDGIKSRSEVADFGALTRQTHALVETLRQEKYLDVVKDLPEVKIIEGRAKFLSPQEVEVAGETLIADRVIIATGARTHVPEIPGLAEIDYLITDTAFELAAAPKSLLVLGGRYIALECAQMFARLGVKTTVLQRSDRILPTESAELTDALTGYLCGEGLNIQTGVNVLSVRPGGEGVEIEASIEGKRQIFTAERVLLATGRTPNTDGLNLKAAGVALDHNGFIEVDAHQQTSTPGIYGAGDVVGDPMFVYTAAYEGALAAENACAVSGSNPRERDYNPLPWVVFTDPQVAGVGMDLQQAKATGHDAETITLPMSKVPRALAARDTRGFLQLIRDRRTDRILGARVLAHEGSELMMEISLALRHEMTAGELASMFHPYLTLSEAVKLAALSFGKDVDKLSCCAT